MDVLSILMNQILLMFILMFIGVYLCKTNKLSLEGSKTLGNILLYIVIPFVVIKAYLTVSTPDKVKGLFISLIISLLCLVVAMIISTICFKKHPIEQFGVSFSNAGFIGIPIVSALYGDDAVFYVSSFVAFVNIFQWTYGVFLFSKNTSSIQPKKIMTNPIVLSFLVGLLIFVSQIKVPTIIHTTIANITAINSPLAMFSLGTYLAQVSFKELFTNHLAYYTSIVRLIVIPIITILILSFIPHQYQLLKLSLLIAASTPIGSNVAIFAQLYQQDYKQAVIDVCMSTLFCIISLPIILLVSNYIW